MSDRDSAQWRSAFLIFAFLVLLAVVGVAFYLPRVPAETNADKARLVAPVNGAAIPGRREVISVPDDGVELGLGWDSRYGRVVANRCIDFAPVSVSAQKTRLDFKEVSDKSEMMQALGVSAAVSVDTMFASGSAEASFARDSKVSSSTNTVVMKATVENGVLFAGPRRAPDRARHAYPDIVASDGGDPSAGIAAGTVTEYAVALNGWARDLARDDLVRFRRACGDSYIFAINTGASLVASFSFSSRNSSVVTKAKAAIKGSYGPVSVSAAISSENASALEQSGMEARVMQVGGSGGPIPTTVDELKGKLSVLALEASRAPIFQTMDVRTYDGLPNWPRQGPVDDGKDSAEAVSDTYWFLASLYDSIEDVLQHPADYDFRTGKVPADLEKLQDEIVRVRAGIRATMAAITGQEETTAEGSGRFDLDFGGTRELEIQAPSAVLSASELRKDGERDPLYDAFARELRASVLYGNPATLRLHLPMPAGVARVSAMTAGALQWIAVDYHLRAQAKRMCNRDPADEECLTNAELRELARQVAVNLIVPTGGEAIQNVGDGSCLVLPASSHSFHSRPCAEAFQDNRGAFESRGANNRRGFGRVGVRGCVVAIDSKRLVEGSCNAQDHTRTEAWRFDAETGQIKAANKCIESAGPGRPAIVADCVAAADGTRAAGREQQVWRLVTEGGQ